MENLILNQLLEELRSLNTKMDKLSDKIEKQNAKNVDEDNLLLTEIVRVEKKNENNHNEVINALEGIQISIKRQ
ncbi:hypothetical protein [Cytobacillus firmus]|uniref:hypothetical protein n=1 Tax=Cytobacillus firmus TaxID=1399 RepID=UPI001C947E59|nr:hypothetical protein [Cytobacillus firmus]MBY6052781.1 hypothetical protein [Cytobacillus firmus]